MKKGYMPFDIWGGTGKMDTRLMTIIPFILYLFKQHLNHDYNNYHTVKYGISITPVA